MNQPEGLLRDEREFMSDYRQRAYWIGIFQLTGAITYLLGALFLNELLSITALAFNPKFSYFIESGNQTLGQLEIQIENRNANLAISKLHFWMVLNSIRALLHVVSSVLIMCATCECTSKWTAMRFCAFTSMMNLSFLLYEIVVFVFIQQEWKLAFYFVLYRIWFNHEVMELRSQVRMLSRSPPGYQC